MALWEAILCALLAAALGGLYLAGAFRQRRASEPPLEKGWIPWLGYALEFRHNAVDFLARMQKKHGNIFTVLLGGHYFTFLMDPLSFGTVVKEARAKLDFIEFAEELVQKVFGYKPSLMTHKIIESASTKHLKGNGLVGMTQAMMDGLQAVMLHSLGSAEGQNPWKQDGLFHYCYNTVFRAGYLALYGNEKAESGKDSQRAKRDDLRHSEAIYEEFRKYDRLFPRFSTSTLSYGKKKEAERLTRLFWGILSVKNVHQKENISGWVREQEQQLAEEGMPEYMRDRFMFLLLWAAQGNTGPASFWLLLHLLKSPEAMEEVRQEVDRVVRDSGQEAGPGAAVINVTKDMLAMTPVLDSAVEETLRLSAAPLLVRAVQVDMKLKLNDGREYALRKGDRVAIFPYLVAHMDPEIHPEPHVFKYDRFLTRNGVKKEFYKDGRKVKYFTMPWGAGTSMCPGRYFAVNEMKLFVFLMLTYFEMELVDSEEEVPPLDKSRYGFGVLQPAHDLQFRYRPRY